MVALDFDLSASAGSEDLDKTTPNIVWYWVICPFARCSNTHKKKKNKTKNKRAKMALKRSPE